MKKLKFGFDIHGVLDDLPETFVELNQALYDAGHEIHILTGSHASDKVFSQLTDLGFRWHKFFSIADYHKENKDTKMWYHNGTPWIDKTEWDKTKGDYCRREGIHLHFDDTPEYEGYFTTPFARVWTKNNRNGRGTKTKGDFITDHALNELGFAFVEKEQFTGMKAWIHNTTKAVDNINSLAGQPQNKPIFIYWPDINRLNDINNENHVQPKLMTDIRVFMEQHSPK